MLARLVERMVPGGASRLPFGFRPFRAAPHAAGAFSNVVYQGMVDNSMSDLDSRHVILEFPEASGNYLGARYVLKFVQHYVKDLWRGKRVIVQNGRTSLDADGTSITLTMEIYEQRMHDMSTIGPGQDERSNDVPSLEHNVVPHLSPAGAIFQGSGIQGLPNKIVLSLHEVTSSNMSALKEYDLFPTSQEA